ncbi:MAG: di-heme oxidoredictase family protein, partial [Rhizobiaceae bacterium]
LELARSENKAIIAKLITKGVSFGRLKAKPDGLVDLSRVEGVDDDLVIRPFGQKGVMTSLRQFTINAMNAHHGMQASERFGRRWTASADFDGDRKHDELRGADISALVAWQATRAPPMQDFADNEEWKALAAAGRNTFNSIGCGTCHIPELPLKSLNFADPGPADAAGTLSRRHVQEPAIYDLALLEWAKALPRNDRGEPLVPLFGDLKRHRMTDNQVDGFGNELLAQRFVDRTVFATAELWGVGSTAPYGHRNDMTTLDEVIRAHSGEARESRDAYVEAEEQSRRSIIAFLRSLRIAK